ncbi:hypothetical protein [Lysinibacillus pakistanensis]|uniref:hypothetical protein n=1 Tax=Lysinibacillus pakistanensis TaxID=759811 RepID=UPI003D2CF61E
MEDILFNLLFEFSEVICVAPPTSMSNILEWWGNALKEMNDYWLIDLIEFRLFFKSETPIVQTMHNMLIEQCKGREILNAFT